MFRAIVIIFGSYFVLFEGVWLMLVFLIHRLMQGECAHLFLLLLVDQILLYSMHSDLLFQNQHLGIAKLQIIQFKPAMSQYYPQGGQVSRARSNSQSLLSVYLQSLVYYDQIYSYFAIVFQYFIFIYKYNILYYKSSVIAGELILLSLLLPINSVRIYSARAGNKGKKYSYLTLFLVLDILLIIGTIYIIALQTNALYLQATISIIELVLSSLNFVMAIILMIMYRASQ